MPSQGKTYYSNTTIKSEREIWQRHVQVISANLLATKGQAKDKGIKLTDKNKGSFRMFHHWGWLRLPVYSLFVELILLWEL